MTTAYLAHRIAKYLEIAASGEFPDPVTEITVAMQNDLNIHTLREVNVRINGRTVGVCLNYCAWSGGKPYVVSGYDILGHMFVESFDTQDEALQEYAVRAAYVGTYMSQGLLGLGAELGELSDLVG